jgi:outer membrane biosynthesis protein TonB
MASLSPFMFQPMILVLATLLLPIVSSHVQGAEKFPEVSLGLIDYALPRFPPELVGVKAGDGEVIIAVTIDAAGAVDDSVILEATNEAFARSTTLAVSSWQFSVDDSVSTKASSEAGSMLPRREVLQFSFKRSGVVTSLNHGEAARASFVTPNIPQFKSVPWSALDSEPQRLSATMPSLSSAMQMKLGTQPLQVNFVIDREGYVRVPVINVADPELAKVVLAAVRTWRYTSPVHQQQAVAVEVTKALVLVKQ